jgi:hypothetical protein
VVHHQQTDVTREAVSEERIEIPDGTPRDRAQCCQRKFCAYQPPKMLRQRVSGIMRLHGIENLFGYREHRQWDQ